MGNIEKRGWGRDRNFREEREGRKERLGIGEDRKERVGKIGKRGWNRDRNFNEESGR